MGLFSDPSPTAISILLAKMPWQLNYVPLPVELEAPLICLSDGIS
jgi:hypothetical protein